MREWFTKDIYNKIKRTFLIRERIEEIDIHQVEIGLKYFSGIYEY